MSGRAVAAGLVALPVGVLAGASLWLAHDHGTLWLLPVVVHEGGRRSLAGTIVYPRHLLRELPIIIVYGMAAVASWRTWGPPGTVGLTRRWQTIAFLAFLIVIAAAWLATARALGSDVAAAELLQGYVRDDEAPHAGAHWRYHLFSTVAYVCGTAPVAAVLGWLLAGRHTASGRSARWVVFAAAAILLPTAVAGLTIEPFVDARYLGHQAREAATHLLVTLPLSFVGPVALYPPTGGGEVGERRVMSAGIAGGVSALALLYLVIGAVVAGSAQAGRPGVPLSSLLGAHVFEHTADYLLVVMLVVALARWGTIPRVSDPLVILGGGPAGLAVGYYATQDGHPVLLFERDDRPGGLCRTLECGPHRYDVGAHRFHDQDADVTADVRALLGDRLLSVDAPSRIYDGRRFIDFPPTPLGMLASAGVGQAGRIFLELLRGRYASGPCVSFEDFAIRQFGETLARRFLIRYSEKLWGLPAHQLSPDIATRRLKGMTLRSLVLEFVTPRRKTEHIDGRFLYPRGGYGDIAAALAARVPAAALRTEHEVIRFDCRRGWLERIHFRGRQPLAVAGRIVSTLPLSVTARLLRDVLPEAACRAAAALRFRTIRLVFLRLAKPRVTPCASLYLPDPALCVSRVSEPKNRSRTMAPTDETALVAEVPCFPGDSLAQQPDAAVAARVVDELAGVGLLRRNEVVEWRHHLLPHAYPVYGLGWERQVAIVVAALEKVRNLDLVGRGGLFFYSHLHDQMRMGKDYVRTLATERYAAALS